MERYIPFAQTRAKPLCVCLLLLQAGYKGAVLGTTILSNGPDRSKWTTLISFSTCAKLEPWDCNKVFAIIIKNGEMNFSQNNEEEDERASSPKVNNKHWNK